MAASVSWVRSILLFITWRARRLHNSKKTALASVPPFLQAQQPRFQVTLLEDLRLSVIKACSLGFPAYASLSNDEPKEKFPTLLLPTNSDTVTE